MKPANSPTQGYREALARFRDAQHRVQELVDQMKAVAYVLTGAALLNLSSWPNAATLSQALRDCYVTRRQMLAAWKLIPAQDRGSLTPPPP
jgi:hypothetical protein